MTHHNCSDFGADICLYQSFYVKSSTPHYSKSIHSPLSTTLPDLLADRVITRAPVPFHPSSHQNVFRIDARVHPRGHPW